MVWGPLIAIYLFLAGASAGAFLASAYIERKYPDAVRMRVAGRILVPIFIGIGLVMLMVDAEAGLHNPLRFIFLVMNPGSVMTLGVYFICVFMPVALIEAVLELLKKDVPRWLTVIGDVFAFAVAAYTGFLLGVVDAYPLWNNAILPVLFVISALASGLAAVNLCGLILDRENIEKMFDLKKGHVVLGAAEIIALVVMFIIVASGDPQGAASIQSMLTGGFAGMFWIGLVLVGLLMPLLIGANALRASEGSQSSVALEYASECGVLVGGFMLRLLVVLAALPIVFV
ncbi:NrfD/PsrC family molybdoenzyme membrane anchor subunit [Slackia sp. CM382]|uniref:NrfD/PsrC family molybdoenzyme membrane anchor subunit n=1 Tax=Slackia sp. CM382 TaxID=1111137 RepID=UPI000587965F|nr:NrfD/PsrC family molybdoenzyme membrane anchor subunit [Slackia sp. CM382]